MSTRSAAALLDDALDFRSALGDLERDVGRSGGPATLRDGTLELAS